MRLSIFDPTEEFEEMNEDLVTYVAERDEQSCQLQLAGCQRRGSDPHHVIYKSHLGKNCANNLILLCKLCHGKLHNVKDQYKELLLNRIKENEIRLRESLS